MNTRWTSNGTSMLTGSERDMIAGLDEPADLPVRVASGEVYVDREGNLWLSTGEMNPRLVGWIAPPEQEEQATAAPPTLASDVNPWS
jgi:hypothetical protein